MSLFWTDRWVVFFFCCPKNRKQNIQIMILSACYLSLQVKNIHISPSVTSEMLSFDANNPAITSLQCQFSVKPSKRGQRLTGNQTPSEHLSPPPPLLSFDWWPLLPRLPFVKCEIVTLEALTENTNVNLKNAALICSVSSCRCTKINPLFLSF